MNQAACWSGPVPDIDDFGCPIVDEFIDGATRMGPWAIMTPQSHRVYGRGLGTGLGQRYRLKAKGYWPKVEG